ncbi:MAG: hypothetical protein N2439_17450, partial [Anaerolineae bacterium]|nr:hypothetical protein [Anaerolineae bacterium]
MDLPLDRLVFLEGPAGAGKTTAAVARLLRWLEAGVPADAILVLIPQRTLAGPYTAALRQPTTPPGGEVTVVTLGGLAQRMVELFWPQVAGPAGFDPSRPPVFLTLETAQYYMARIVRPLLDEGYFDSIRVDRNRLYSQILDNLNKAAVVGFPYTEIAARLKAAWIGETSQARVYDEAQECATRFREYCLAHNLLDFSLQYELFARRLWPLPACRSYLTARYRYLIADNVEEDTPAAHDILLEWLPFCRSALIVYDWNAGNRRFLGADPESAYRLKEACTERVALAGSLVASPHVEALAMALARGLGRRPGPPAQAAATTPIVPLRPAEGSPRAALEFCAHRYHPEMLDWVADEIGRLVHDRGVPPGEIAVLAPFLTGALRFALGTRLEARGIPVRSHRPSRTLAEEPATQCLLTLAAFAHPHWGLQPSRYDVAHALMQAIEGLDLVRAHLLAAIAYRTRDGAPILLPFADIEPPMQERITFLIGGRYEGLRTWLAAQIGRSQRPGGSRGERRTRGVPATGLDHFLARLFGELLSQPGYGFHRNYDAGEIAANLIESARKFRQVMGEVGDVDREYVQMVQDGVVAAQYVRSWQRQPQEAVLLAPAHTFLMSNRPVMHQFWLDVGGTGWWERLYQPLTHPYVPVSYTHL